MRFKPCTRAACLPVCLCSRFRLVLWNSCGAARACCQLFWTCGDFLGRSLCCVVPALQWSALCRAHVMFCDIMDVPVRTAGTAIMWKPAGCLCHTCALPSAKLPSFLLSFLPFFLPLILFSFFIAYCAACLIGGSNSGAWRRYENLYFQEVSGERHAQTFVIDSRSFLLFDSFNQLCN